MLSKYFNLQLKILIYIYNIIYIKSISYYYCKSIECIRMLFFLLISISCRTLILNNRVCRSIIMLLKIRRDWWKWHIFRWHLKTWAWWLNVRMLRYWWWWCGKCRRLITNRANWRCKLWFVVLSCIFFLF